jgi:tripartite-type tricarboxylate transporter receptor subunit TctC
MMLGKIARYLALTVCSLAAVQAGAQAAYPAAQPIRIIVPFTPGGTVDILARLIGQQISKPLGQTVIVENKPGAGSALGSDYVAKASADGYTLLMASTSSMVINPNLQKLPYKLSDFAPVALVASVPHVIVINPNIPARNLKEFLAYAKQSGKVNYATAGTGTPHHLAGALLAHMTGVPMTDVPYKGTGPALIDVASGQVQLMSCDLPPALPFITSGRVRALGVAAKTRSPQAPDIPTIAEAGLPDFEVTGWYGVVAPAGVPKNVVDKVAAAIAQAMGSAEVKEKLAQLGATPENSTPKDFGDFMQRESAKWSGVIKSANIKID